MKAKTKKTAAPKPTEQYTPYAFEEAVGHICEMFGLGDPIFNAGEDSDSAEGFAKSVHRQMQNAVEREKQFTVAQTRQTGEMRERCERLTNDVQYWQNRAETAERLMNLQWNGGPVTANGETAYEAIPF